RAGAQIPEPALGRPTAARGHREIARDAAEDHAVRRAHLGARSRNDQRGARGHGRPRARGDDDAVRDARDGVRAARGRHHGVHGPRRDRRGWAARGVLLAAEDRTLPPVSQPDPEPLMRTAILATVLLAGCSGGYTWGWYVVSPWGAKGQSNILFLLTGLGWTVAVAACAIVASVILGLLVALIGLAPNRYARTANWIYVESLRSIPVLDMVLGGFYGL